MRRENFCFLCFINTNVTCMRQAVFLKLAYRELPDRNKWRHWVLNTDELHCFALPSRTGRPLGLFFFKEGRIRSLATGGGQMEELKTCLKEYRLPQQRAINGRNMVPKAAFDKTGRHSLGDIRWIRLNLCPFIYDAPNDVIFMAAPDTTVWRDKLRRSTATFLQH